ncbi:L,D-transpeptidase [Actinomadura algeriensis]|uniref:Lipoprotein-anchoring transpeptidase ErfK/SrfK n=1 Tax=Actinomadura algeriensis TaxID=1679523 RepID=A0ABR9JNL7_9ACTN|nr:L,D-transpeptidase [Actinomadura algeriensis]MBE1531946.1 lipoprotein-anchoring transpeptidase ErfK/SrfK [Actinomadura algeriensis]
MATMIALRMRAITASALVPVAALLLAGCGGAPGRGEAAERSAAPSPGTAAKPAGDAAVPEATTFTTVEGAPADRGREATDGLVVQPVKPLPVLDRPGGNRVATLPTEQLGGPTWVPVVESSGGWRRVLLPSRPNRASGWISGEGLREARTSYLVTVDLGDRRLTLRESGRTVGRWKVAIGEAATPTPTGRTFVMAQLAPEKKQPSPLVLPLGAHSDTLDTFGGGPGTVALHGWNDVSVFGRAATHGCVRVPDEALRKLSRVPLGTLVLIND